jgi:tetratricopeptide (TPR) repeat protein
MSKITNHPRNTPQAQVSPAAPPRSRWRLALVAVLVLAAVGGGAGWWWWRGPTPPLPEIPLKDCEPAVVQAIEAARDEVAREPRSGAAWGKLGQVLLAHDLADPAVVCFLHAERFDADNPRWPYFRALVLQFQDPEAAVAALRRAAELCDNSDPDNLTPRLRLGEALLQLGRAEEAEAEFAAALVRQRGNARALYGLGLAAAARGDLEGARGHLEACSGHAQTQKKAAAELAKVLMRRGDPAGAARAEARARDLPPDRDWPDRYATEVAALKVARQDRLRRAVEMIKQGNAPDSIPLLEQLIKEQPDCPAYLYQGMALHAMRDYPRAEAALRKAAELDPQRFEPRHQLSILLVEQFQRSGSAASLGEAVAFGKQAIALKPDHAFAHLWVALALKGQGQRPQALAEFRTAVRCNPDHPDPYVHLAAALLEEGQKDEARRLVEQARRLARPSHRWALDNLAKLEQALTNAPASK